VLTQAEFCRTLEISRTSLWRYVRWDGKLAKDEAPVIIVAKADLDSGWQEEARKLCEQFVTYGYRRVCALLDRAGHVVGKHRLRVWMQETGLAQRGPVKDTGRTPGEPPPAPGRPNQAWQIDATKIYTNLDGWVWQTSVLDLYDRRIVGHVVRKTCRAEDAKDVLAIALDRAFGESKPEDLSLIHDRGSQFTAWSFKEMVDRLRIKDVVTAVRHPQSCGRLERFHRTLKEECIWLSEWESLDQLKAAVGCYIEHYNNDRIHSALGYLTPMEMHTLAMTEKTSLQIAA
jgi:putative transposase